MSVSLSPCKASLPSDPNNIKAQCSVESDDCFVHCRLGDTCHNECTKQSSDFNRALRSSSVFDRVCRVCRNFLSHTIFGITQRIVAASDYNWQPHVKTMGHVQCCCSNAGEYPQRAQQHTSNVVLSNLTHLAAALPWMITAAGVGMESAGADPGTATGGVISWSGNKVGLRPPWES